METRKQNLFLAMFLSLLICLAGSIVWGLIYYAGYFAAYIALAEVILATLVYSKFKHLNWFGILWVCLLTIIFNEISMYLVNILVISKEYTYTFSQSVDFFKTLYEWSPEFKNAFMKDTWLNVIFTCIGIVIFVISFNKQKRAKKESETQTETQPQQNIGEIKDSTVFTLNVNKVDDNYKFEIQPKSNNIMYLLDSIIAEFNKIVENFKLTSNREIFKADLKALKEQKIKDLTIEQKEELKKALETKISTETNTNVKKNLNILLTQIK